MNLKSFGTKAALVQGSYYINFGFSCETSVLITPPLPKHLARPNYEYT